MALSRGPAVVLAVIAIVIAVGHVCAMPLHAHAGTAAAHDDGSHHPAGAGLHDASCETVTTTAITVVAPASRAAGPGAAAAPAGAPRAGEAPGAPRADLSSPPRYLLHAVLLI